ncbi:MULTISPECIES: EscU/YscU/HrcU family type III secretion system export apparatus switch protein [unclassified Modicisalibacter]|uniref:EscU/YscU/HrcU family type III secretion system export apparatus switch protein n=1 Tax=unclassified Modicisalibacter TaxID=2679913 RepID=UPI001CCD35F9|nr:MULTISPECIES: EscU/YscU/HrcU family type III secretion system export apparatus switch protein [unclassified Modicisalibacter]MBZ9556957.1 EscU/YscU/HrcU family type III secretion system export apparatus switch protein [Modicisalibacter sp. R2A 31.J]MBZ9574329.1 EscU/YscU/HrcU family type III secretion system export apparatus switch protein [Modicisalibacter sp. MOD 31.J]
MDSRRQAVALAYQEGDKAPQVVAKGYGELAERIVAEARRQGIFVHDAPELVGLLMQVDLDARIPPMLYQVVAELLVWVYGLEQQAEDGPASANR